MLTQLSLTYNTDIYTGRKGLQIILLKANSLPYSYPLQKFCSLQTGKITFRPRMTRDRGSCESTDKVMGI